MTSFLFLPRSSTRVLDTCGFGVSGVSGIFSFLFFFLIDAFDFGRRDLSNNNHMKTDEPQRHARCYD